MELYQVPYHFLFMCSSKVFKCLRCGTVHSAHECVVYKKLVAKPKSRATLKNGKIGTIKALQSLILLP